MTDWSVIINPCDTTAMPKIVNRAEREIQLMGAAIEIFAEQGYHRATMQAVADRAGVSKGGIYDYFPSKEALLVRAAEWQFEQLVEADMAAMEQGDAPIAVRLERFAQTATGHLEQWTGAAMLVIQIWAEMGREDGPLRTLMADLYTHAVGRVQAVLENAIARGEVPAFNARAAATVMLAAMDGAVLQSILLPTDLRAAVDSGAYTRLCLGLLPAQPGGTS